MENSSASCLRCGAAPTIKSHLIPKAMAREVQVGKSHAVAYGAEKFVYTQSGLYEQTILCAGCDHQLGTLENTAIQAFRDIRKQAKTAPFGEYALQGVAGDDILRFVCGVLWKYSVAARGKGRIELGPYQETVRDVAFSAVGVPPTIDALVLRLKRAHDDEDVFAYRAPKPDRQEGVNGYRLLVGGVFIFARVDKQVPTGGAMQQGTLRNRPHLSYAVLPAQGFEEYRLAAKLVHGDGPLARFIDRQEPG